MEKLYAAIDESGLDQYVYRRTASADADAAEYYEWPTMESLIAANTRLVMFAHGDGMDDSCATVACPEGMFYMFDQFEQTNWNDATCEAQSESPSGC